MSTSALYVMAFNADAARYQINANLGRSTIKEAVEEASSTEQHLFRAERNTVTSAKVTVAGSPTGTNSKFFIVERNGARPGVGTTLDVRESSLKSWSEISAFETKMNIVPVKVTRSARTSWKITELK